MGVYKICSHKGRARERCEHAWWGCYRRRRVSLANWVGREIRGKAEATVVLEQMRAAIRSGTFDKRGAEPPRETTPLTFRDFAEVYKQRHVLAKALACSSDIDYRLKPLIDGFGDRWLADIRTADIEDFIADLKKPRIVRGSRGRLTTASINRSIQLLRHMFNWALGREYIERTPFRRGTQLLIRLEHEDNVRRRRISEDEEARLLDMAPPFLRSMIIAALDTGMRRGEMLALRFVDIDWNRELIVLRGSTTKSGKTRFVPISTARLRTALEWLRIDAAGKPKPNNTAVFSDEVGEPVGCFKRAWTLTVLKAHGISPQWTREYGWKETSPECKRLLREIDLHWHDLRHEYASRLVERGVPLAQVRDLLGHASIKTTERYDCQTLENLQAAAARLDSGKRFEPRRPAASLPKPARRRNAAEQGVESAHSEASSTAECQALITNEDAATSTDYNSASEGLRPEQLPN